MNVETLVPTFLTQHLNKSKEIKKKTNDAGLRYHCGRLGKGQGRSKIFLFVLTAPTNGLFVSIEFRSTPIDLMKN